jgi:hypothetical protein
MRNAKPRQADPPRSKEKQIEIQRARPVSRPSGLSPRFAFELLEERKKLEGSETGFTDENGIEVIGLRWPADGRGRMQRGRPGFA